MDSNLVALKLMLDSLQVDFDINEVEQRKLIQKAVYLGQRAGVDLGYRFSWYLMGPYSSALTRDYYALDDSDKAEIGNRSLVESARRKLDKVAPLMKGPPPDVSLSRSEWVELVASLDYLLTVSGYPFDKAVSVLRDEKRKLAPFAERAREALLANPLTSASSA
ncbi:MAG: hypothetical protein KIT58_04350 [Planctomycetota bacterium]|nr:hypothetical protein [Planctomycetota bacterium]